MPESVFAQAHAIENQLVDWRRDFHAHPEMGFEEKRTAAEVAGRLVSFGCRVETGVGRTGVVAELGQGGPIVAIRADMDALPIQENNRVPYASQAPGVMHACGHDAHVSMALGAAALLSRQELTGTARFIFQPSEETSDSDGVSGAARMVQAGVMEGVEAVIALHVDASVAVGDVALDAGPSSAGVDTLYGTIIGQGGHGATPQKVIDPIYIASHVVLALHGIVSRRLHPYEPAVLSVGSIHGGEAHNVIPEQVEITGTIRYMARQVQAQIHEEIERAMKVARALGGDYRLRIEEGYPPMFNDPRIVKVMKEVVVDLLGGSHLKSPVPEMGAEDFGFFSNLAPGAMFYLGCRLDGDERKHHHPRFDIDEGCLPIGTAVLTESALRLLKTLA